MNAFDLILIVIAVLGLIAYLKRGEKEQKEKKKSVKKKKVKKLGKQRAIKLNLNRTFEEKKFGCDRNIVKDGNNNVTFEPSCVFSEKKRKLFGLIPRFWKGSRNLILFVDGAVNALKFGEVKEEMNPFWTQKEERELVKREMKKSLAKHKPMSWMQFIIILIPIGICLILLLKMATYLGAL